METRVYICGWRQSPTGFCLWSITEPQVSVEGANFALAEELLLEGIRDQGGAMVPVLEFNPPLPKSELEAKYDRPDLYLISGDDRFETSSPKGIAFETAKEREARIVWLDKFFEQPVCRKCVAPTSSRNGTPLPVTYVPSQHDGAFGHIGNFGSTWVEIVSEEFLSILTVEERQRFQFRTVIRGRKSRSFYELLGPPGPSFVAVKSLPVNGWRCTDCGRRTWSYWIKDFSFHQFVAESDLPRNLPGLFTVGIPPRVHLCATGARWRELVGKKGARGFVSHPLGVVPEHEMERCPDLPTYEESLKRNR